MKKNIRLPTIDENAELALAFFLLSKDTVKKGVKILSFSKILWPLLSIQGVISTHIILDGLSIFSKDEKFSNPPRQPLIGHILRNADHRREIELLNRIIEVLLYKDAGAEETGSGEESEYQSLSIKGLIDPENLQSILKLVPFLEYQSIKPYTLLDTILGTDDALDVSQRYRNLIKTMKGNASRWKNQISLIGDEIQKWMTNLNVKIKDTELRFTSELSKAKGLIDANQAKTQKNTEFDKIEHWNVSGKKNIIENIKVLFKTVEIQLQEIIKKNQSFTDEKSFKSKVYEDLLQPFEEHFNLLKKEGKHFLDTIESLYQKYNDFKDEAFKIDAETAIRLNSTTTDISSRLEDRDQQIIVIEREREEKLKELKEYKNQIETTFTEIKSIIQNKEYQCKQEAEELTNWSIKDTQDELFSKPIQWIYMPLYVMFSEDEDMMEEKTSIVLPGYYNNDPNSIYEDLSESFKEFKKLLLEKLEDDVRIRSNFEFSSESKNLLKEPDLKKRLNVGISILKKYSIFNDNIEEKLNEIINNIP